MKSFRTSLVSLRHHQEHLRNLTKQWRTLKKAVESKVPVPSTNYRPFTVSGTFPLIVFTTCLRRLSPAMQLPFFRVSSVMVTSLLNSTIPWCQVWRFMDTRLVITSACEPKMWKVARKSFFCCTAYEADALHNMALVGGARWTGHGQRASKAHDDTAQIEWLCQCRCHERLGCPSIGGLGGRVLLCSKSLSANLHILPCDTKVP